MCTRACSVELVEYVFSQLGHELVFNWSVSCTSLYMYTVVGQACLVYVTRDTIPSEMRTGLHMCRPIFMTWIHLHGLSLMEFGAIRLWPRDFYSG